MTLRRHAGRPAPTRLVPSGRWRRVVAGMLWAVVVLTASGLLVRGLWMMTYLEPTGDALRRAATGGVVTAAASALLLLAAWYAVAAARRPGWVGIAVAAPAVVSGGSALLASGTLLPVLSILVTLPSAVVGVIGGVLGVLGERQGRPHPRASRRAGGGGLSGGR